MVDVGTFVGFIVVVLTGILAGVYLGYAWGSIRTAALMQIQLDRWQQWAQVRDEVRDEVSGEWTAVG